MADNIIRVRALTTLNRRVFTGVQAATGCVPPAATPRAPPPPPPRRRWRVQKDDVRAGGRHCGHDQRHRVFRVRDGCGRFRGGRGQVRVRGVRGRPLAAGGVQRPQRVVQRRALQQQPRDGGHAAAAAAATAAAVAAGHLVGRVLTVTHGRTAAPGQLRGPVRRHGGHPAQGWPRGQGADATGPMHAAHQRVAQLVHGAAGRAPQARLGARLEDDAAQRGAAATAVRGPLQRQAVVALPPVPSSSAAAAAATTEEPLPAATAVGDVQRRRWHHHGGRHRGHPVPEPLDHTHAPQRRQAVPATAATVQAVKAAAHRYPFLMYVSRVTPTPSLIGRTGKENASKSRFSDLFFRFLFS